MEKAKRSMTDLLASRKKHFLPTAGFYHGSAPLHLVKALGCHVWDAEGRQYLDAIGGIVCISAGHNHPRIVRALQEMLEANTIQHTSVLYLTQAAVEAAEALIGTAPKGIDRVSFTNSGSEANELAFMAARHATGETAMVSLRHAYHGGTSATLAQGGHHTWRFRAQPPASAVHAIEPYCYRCPFGKTPNSCALECAKDVEKVIQTATNGRIAGFIAEPVMGVGGFITPPPEYFHTVSEIVHRYGGKYISDEVQTGAGRCGKEFLLTKELGIKADMITMAKGLGNGAAVGAILMKSDVADSLSGKLYFNTFGADPYQMVQMKLTVDIVHDEKMIDNARVMGERLKQGLEDLMKRHNHIGDVRGRGLLLGMELVKDRGSKAYGTEEALDLMDFAKNRGVLLGKGGLFGNVIRMAPPLSLKSDQVDQIVEVLDQSFVELEKKYGKPAAH
jgi:alanine-glyoxylate transaminase / (R)-3-amino-2-methylpropionate-pyruvate transaminase